MLSFFAILMICGTSVYGQEGEIIVPDNKTECINEMIEWCDGMQYPQQGVGLAVVSITYEDPKGYYRVLCSSDSDGTNCTRNRTPWFACSPDHEVSYKGQVITNTSNDVDDEICKTADKAFNEIFVQNLSYQNTSVKTEVEKGMEAFFDQMAAMEEQIELIQRILRKLPALGDFWNEFNDSFLFIDGSPESDSAAPRSEATAAVLGSETATATPSSETATAILGSESTTAVSGAESTTAFSGDQQNRTEPMNQI